MPGGVAAADTDDAVAAAAAYTTADTYHADALMPESAAVADVDDDAED